MAKPVVDGHFFKSALDLDNTTISEIVSRYLKTVITSSVVSMVIAGALIGYCICFSGGTTIDIIIGIVGGVAEIFLTLRVITALLSAGKISKKNFTWVRGMITGYKFLGHGGIPSLYAMIDSTYLCTKWANPLYKESTVVYFLQVGNSEYSFQNVMVKSQ